ncbi:MAG: IS3 family transposase [Acidaminococcaceae bacterium]|nr:IS3 family transposase [Acidaminococcaceae bacterium]
MYSYDERIKAVKLYIQYDKSYASLFRELGYPPSSHTIKLWYKEYQQHGDLHKSFKKTGKYSKEQRQAAIQYYIEHGRSKTRTIQALGYPSRQQLAEWLKQDCPEEVHPCAKGQSLVHLSKEQKEQVAIELCTRDGSAQEIADKYNVSRYSVYNWAWHLLGKGNVSIMPQKKRASKSITSEEVDSLKQEIEQLHLEAEELQRQVYRLRLEKDVLEKAAEIIKKDEGVSLEKLTNREKTIVIGALRHKYKLQELLNVFHMAKSSFCYQQAVLKAPDKYSELRKKIRCVFDESSSRYGYRRIHISLKAEAVTVSEKVIRRIMQEDKLIVPNVKRRKYNSYQGEITPAVPNIIERNFHAEQPNMKWLTDITEFHIPAGKIYLSPLIDCFDGLPVSWTIGISPDANLVNTMLDSAIGTLNEDEHPIVHSDRGAHYRWPGWIERMEKAGLIRSMSKKGCSPDNSACEGFFGRLKNEMFYGRSWRGVTIEEFIKTLDEYIHWYAEKRIKISLGGLSPLQYRKSLGLVAI